MEILRWKTRIAVLWIFMAVAMSILVFTGNGCSIVGLGIGSAVDQSFPRSNLVSKEHLQSIEVGSTVEITFFNKTSMTGTYLGFGQTMMSQGVKADNSAPGGISCIDLIILRTPSGMNEIRIEEVESIKILKNGNMKWIGLLIGIGLDVAWISSQGIEVFGGDWDLNKH